MIIPADAIRALYIASATKDVRSYLNSVYFEPSPGGVIAVATDGHLLLALKIVCDDVPGQSFIVPKEMLKIPAHTETVELTANENTLVVAYNGLQIQGAPIAARYPDWRKIIPHDYSAKREPATYDPALLMRLQKMQAAFGKAKWSIYVRSAGNAIARVMLPACGYEYIAVVAPLRVKEAEYVTEVPDWACDPVAAML